MFGIFQILQGVLNLLVYHFHPAASDQLFHGYEREGRFDSGSIAVHHKSDGASRCDDRYLSVSKSMFFSGFERHTPNIFGFICQSFVFNQINGQRFGGFLVLGDNTKHRFAIYGIGFKRTDPACDLGGISISLAGHERGDGPSPGASFFGVISQALGHEKRTQVRVAQAQLAHILGVFLDFRCGVA